jgi:hypothetical protein
MCCLGAATVLLIASLRVGGVVFFYFLFIFLIISIDLTLCMPSLCIHDFFTVHMSIVFLTVYCGIDIQPSKTLILSYSHFWL